MEAYKFHPMITGPASATLKCSEMFAFVTRIIILLLLSIYCIEQILCEGISIFYSI